MASSRALFVLNKTRETFQLLVNNVYTEMLICDKGTYLFLFLDLFKEEIR